MTHVTTMRPESGLQIGFLVFGVGSAISAIVGSPGQLIASRAVMGVGAALIMPATLSIITNVFPADERPKAIAIWTATAGVAVALGPITGGFLLAHFYWGSIFLVNLPIVAERPRPSTGAVSTSTGRA